VLVGGRSVFVGGRSVLVAFSTVVSWQEDGRGPHPMDVHTGGADWQTHGPIGSGITTPV